MSSERRWDRAPAQTLCGYCRLRILEDAPILVITLPGVTRKLIRCEVCSGPAPPDLAARVSHTPTKAKLKSKSTMTKLADVDDAREWLPYAEK